MRLKVKVTIDDVMLGTNPGNDELFEEWIKGKRDDNAEIPFNEDMLNLPVDEEMEKSTTVFRRDSEGFLCIPGYMLKGNIKACGDQIRQRRNSNKKKDENGKTAKSGWESWVSKVDNNVHIRPKIIRLQQIVDGNPVDVRKADDIIVRPLKCKTMQGERISLARSEAVKPGTFFFAEIEIRGVITRDQIIECLDEGAWYGLGQWRNAGNGTYQYEIIGESN